MGKWIFSQPNDWAGKSGTLPSDGCYHPVSSCDDTNSCQKPVRSRQKPFYHPFFCLSAVNDSHSWCHCCHCNVCVMDADVHKFSEAILPQLKPPQSADWSLSSVALWKISRWKFSSSDLQESRLEIEIVACCHFCFAVLPSNRILQNNKKETPKVLGA